MLGDVARWHPVDPEGEGRDAVVHRRSSVQLAAVREAVEDALPERALVRPDRVPAEILEVLDGGNESGEQLVCERPGLEAGAHRLVRSRPHLVRPPGPQELLAAVGETEVRPE